MKFLPVCVQNQWDPKTFIWFVLEIESFENSMLLLLQGWLQSHYFVLDFTQRSVDMGWGQDSIFVFLVLSME